MKLARKKKEDMKKNLNMKNPTLSKFKSVDKSTKPKKTTKNLDLVKLNDVPSANLQHLRMALLFNKFRDSEV